MDGHRSYQSGNMNGVHLQKFSQNIGSNIQKISQNVKSMKQLVNQLGTDQDSQQLRTQLHQVQHYTGGLAKDTNTELRSFQTCQVPAGEDSRAWKLQAERLTKEFSQALNDFQATQRQAAAKEKESLREAKAHTDAHYFDEKNNSDLVELNSSSGRSETNQMQLQMEKEAELQTLQEREAQIRQLESDITDVNQIFKDLATMVHEQGETIDSIEANIETAQERTIAGSAQIRQAYTYQTKSRKKKICIISTIVITLIIIITIIAATN